MVLLFIKMRLFIFLQKLVNDFAQRLKVKKNNVCVEMPFEKAHLPGEGMIWVENYDETISKHLN